MLCDWGEYVIHVRDGADCFKNEGVYQPPGQTGGYQDGESDHNRGAWTNFSQRHSHESSIVMLFDYLPSYCWRYKIPPKYQPPMSAFEELSFLR